MIPASSTIARAFLRSLLGGLLVVSLAACKAGPSAFDRDRDDGLGPEDTADVSTLPEIPHAPEVETTSVAADEEFGAGGDPPSISGELAEGDAAAEPILTAESTRSDSLFIRPQHVRGIYLNAWASGSHNRVTNLLELAQRTEVNTFVIDIKDASGYVSHRTQVPLAHEIGATEEIRIRDLPGLLRRLSEAGIYPIARIVIVKDPILSAVRPEMAVQDTAGGPWVDGKGIVWLNPHDRRVWEYHVALAREVVEMGFPEVQWDYVRFPDAPRSELERTVFPGAGETTKAEAIRAFLQYAREELAPLGVEVTADVFGVTTSASRDVGIGQVWEYFIDAVDVALPMVYPSHYWQGSFGIDTPNAYPYEIVRSALTDALERSEAVEGAGTTRPWLQDFSLGQPPYGAPEVRAQIEATYDAGIQEWILWNPSSRYTEEALEPLGGFPEEPLIRLGNTLVPVSRRHEFLDSLAAAEAAADSARAAAADSARAAADSSITAPDTLGASGRGDPPDTLGVRRRPGERR